MRYGYSVQLREDLNVQVLTALHARGVVNVTAVAEEVRRSNLSENIALEDVECLVVQVSQFYGAPMEFDGLTAIVEGCGPLPNGELAENGSLGVQDEPAEPGLR
ncbi:hypothetical protein ACFX5Q_23275 [Mesorhizobium sp. IMUNJ 23033]|uniref:hypothetical protein n=1 Tax=Mesorhizobium sp. IMUNJ 23033 TaxID=3378039 RepID=UPI00384C9DEE